MAKVDVGNFMGVIQATENTDDGIRFPGEHMFSGNPVTAPGVTVQELMTDKGMAQQWHQSIMETYEREKDETNQARSEEDTPDLVIRGEAGDAQDGGRGPEPAPVHHQSLEEELQGRYARWENECDQLKARLVSVEDEYREAKKQLAKCETALDAIREV